MKVPAILFAAYLIAVIGFFFFEPSGLIILGFPWSIPIVMLSPVIGHAGGIDALALSLLLSTVPNIVLLFRWILMRHVGKSISVD